MEKYDDESIEKLFEALNELIETLDCDRESDCTLHYEDGYIRMADGDKIVEREVA